MNVIALTTCHNRRDLTLRTLLALQTQRLPDCCRLEICLVDDGSTDDTGLAVRVQFPAVTVLDGPGNLYWAGGMRFGWTHHVSQSDFDYMLVFNDDIAIADDAVAVLLRAAENLESRGISAFALSGAFANAETGRPTYGGVTRSSAWHPLRFKQIEPNGELQACDTLNMNLALLSRGAIERTGFLASDFTHGRADFDFGLRLRTAGGRVVLTPGYIGHSQRNSAHGTSRETALTFMEQWRRLTGLKEQPPRERAVYYRRHGGIMWPFFWILPYLRVIIQGALNGFGKHRNAARTK